MQKYLHYIYLAASASLNINPMYYIIAIIFIIVMTVIILIKNNKYDKKGLLSITQSIALTLLIAYVFLVFVSTVFSRVTKTYYQYELVPFWSYQKIKAEASWIPFWQHSLFWKNLLNVFMLMPMGILLPIIIREKVDSYANTISNIWQFQNKIGKKVFIISFFTSLSIELLQLFMKKGFFEFDDIFHNTLGAVLGYIIYWCVCTCMNWIRNDRSFLRKKLDNTIC